MRHNKENLRTYAVILTKKSSLLYFVMIVICKQINFVMNYKYLGVIIDNTMTVNDNFNQTYKVASTCLQLLSKMKNFTNVKARYAIYTYMIIPLLTCSCPIQSTFTKTQLDSFLFYQSSYKNNATQ